MKKYLKRIHQILLSIMFDPIELINKWRGIPYYICNIFRYGSSKSSSKKFPLSFKNIYPCLNDRFYSAGSARGHYFWQDIWAAKKIFDKQVREHVDVGSRLDGFVSNILAYCQVTYVDLRKLEIKIPNLNFISASITDLPFEDNSIHSMSSLHVIEHVGLGRYGGVINIDAYIEAADELKRVLALGGILLIGTPVGKERLCFDAHRVFAPETIVDIFKPLKLIEFSFIDDDANKIIKDASLDIARQCEYGCGLFVFQKGE